MSSWARAILASVPLALALAPDALAGNIEAVQNGSTLKVTGDDFGAKFFLVGFPGLPNSVHVSVISPTTVNGGTAAVDFFGVESMKVTLGDGTNDLDVGVDLDGGVSIKAGAGNDKIVFLGSEIGGDVSVTGGLGNLDFQFDQGAVDGKLSVKGGPGQDEVSFGEDGYLYGPVKIALGSGYNSVYSLSNFARSLAISCGDGQDTVVFGSGTIGEKLDLKLGDGANLLMNGWRGLRLSVGRLSYKGGSDEDNVFCRKTEVEETASFQLGNGDNYVEVTEQSEIGESLRVSAGDGDDVLNINGSSIGKDAKLRLGAANNWSSSETRRSAMISP